MITQDNYKVEIFAGTTGTEASLGLTDGLYSWAIGGDILQDKGISNPKRSVDMRTGGGKAQENTTSVTIAGPIYKQVTRTLGIVSKRIKVYKNNVEEYTGAITSVDPNIATAKLNINIESTTREVDLPYDRSAIGDVEIDGTVSGDNGYILTLGEPCAMVVDSVDDSGPSYRIKIKGGTQTNRDEIVRIIDDIDARISAGEVVYYVGEVGTYRLVARVSSGTGGVYPYQVGEGVNYSVMLDDVGKYGTILWSTEVFNDGINSPVVIGGKTVDDVNENIFPYKSGSIVDASEGYLWRGLDDGVDYTASVETTAGNNALTDEWQNEEFYNGVYFQSFQGGNPNYQNTGVTGNVSNVVDRSSATDIQASVDYSPGSKSDIGIACGLKFSMKGYKFTAEKLYVVVDFEGVFAPYRKLWMQVWVTSKEGTQEIKRLKVGRFIDLQGQEDTGGLYSYKSTPKSYDNTSRDDFYIPAVRVERSTSYVVDITGTLLDRGGEYYYDGVDFYVAVELSEEGPNTIRQGRSITVKQVNLVEGYQVGRDGLSSNQVIIDNSSTNGTIPLAFEDAVKRQNLFGINSTPPTNGWGTAQVQTDGKGVAIDTNYLSNSLPTGNLNGVLGEGVTTTSLKTEIARSVPALSYYDKYGVEGLLRIGDFPTNNNEILYSDVIGKPSVKAYSGRDIQPALSFEFGKDKKTLIVTNVEQDTYDTSYIVDNIGLTSQERQTLWSAGRLIYQNNGLSTSQTVKKYPLVNDAQGAYRVAISLYTNMGYDAGQYYSRQVVSFRTQKSVEKDLGDAVYLRFPQVTGKGVVSSVEYGVYGGENKYTVEVLAVDTSVPCVTYEASGDPANEQLLASGDLANEQLLADGVGCD